MTVDRHQRNGNVQSVLSRQARRPGRHPATTEIDYSEEQVQFLAAIEAFKRASGRKFPAWSEVLDVVHALGYERVVH